MCSLLHPTTEEIFLSQTQIWPQARLQILQLCFGFRSQHEASALYPARVTMQLFKSVGIIACSRHTEWLNGNRSPQWEIIAFTGTYGPQPLSGYKSVYRNISWRGKQNRIQR